MRLLKKRPRPRKGFAVVMHLDPYALEPVEFPATYLHGPTVKWCHKVLGYSYKKSEPIAPMFSENEIINQINREVRNDKKAK